MLNLKGKNGKLIAAAAVVALLVGGLRAAESKLGHCEDASFQHGADQAGT